MADAGGIRAGRAYVELGATDAQLRAVLDRAAAKLNAFGTAVASIGAKLAAIGTAGLAGFGATVQQVTNLGEQLYRTSQRTGVSVEVLSELRFAAEKTGSDLEMIEGAIKTMGSGLVQAAMGAAEAQDKLLMLGLRIRDLRNLSVVDQFEAIASQIAKIPNPTLRAQRAMEMFGTTSILPMLEGGKKGMAALRAEAQRLGLTMSFATAAAATRLAEATRSLKLSMQAVAIQVGAALVPALAEVAKAIQPIITRAVEWVQSNRSAAVAIAATTAAVTGLGGALVALGLSIKVAALGLSGLGSVVGAVGSAVRLLALPFTAIAGVILGAIGSLALAVKAAFLGMAVAVGPFVVKLALVAAAIAAVIYGLSRLFAARPARELAPVMPALPAGKSNVRSAVATPAGSAPAAAAPVAPDAGKSVGVLEQIAQTSARVWAGVRDRAGQAWATISSTARVAFDSVRTTAETAWGGISAAIEAGRFDLVFQIISTAIQLEWSKLLGFLQTSWLDFKGFFAESVLSLQGTASDAWAGIQSSWVSTTSAIVGDWKTTMDYLAASPGFVAGFWDAFSANIRSTWEVTVGFLSALIEKFGTHFGGVLDRLKAVWESLGGVIEKIRAPLDGFLAGTSDAVERVNRIAAPILRFTTPLGATIGAAADVANVATGRGLTGTDPEANKAQRDERLARVEAERRDRQQAIASEREQARQARDTQRTELQEQIAQRRKAAQVQFDTSVKEAKDALTKKRAEGEEKGKEAARGLDVVNKKVDIQGTFSAQAAFGLGGTSVSERIAVGVQDLNKKVDKLAGIAAEAAVGPAVS